MKEGTVVKSTPARVWFAFQNNFALQMGTEEVICVFYV